MPLIIFGLALLFVLLAILAGIYFFRPAAPPSSDRGDRERPASG